MPRSNKPHASLCRYQSHPSIYCQVDTEKHMTRDLSTIYNAEFFESYNEEQEQDIRTAADGLYRTLYPTTLLDVGCGPGMLVRRLRELGCDARGWDGSWGAFMKASPEVRPFLSCVDISEPPREPPSVEVAVCTEVAEHLPESQADGLVSLLTRVADTIVFTAAPPGQGGYDHINEQPMAYWVRRFIAYDFVVDDVATDALKSAWEGLKRMYFYPANVRVFRRVV